MSDLREIANNGAELLTRLSNVLPDRLHIMRASMAGQPGAQSFESDRTSGHTTTLDEYGTPMPAVSDPTGEAAIRPDQVREDRRHLERHLLAAYRAIDAAAKIVDRYKPRQASDKERAATERMNDPGCPSCARTEVVRGVKRCEPIAKDGYCRFCYEFKRKTGDLPTAEQVENHHRGIKIRRPA